MHCTLSQPLDGATPGADRATGAEHASAAVAHCTAVLVLDPNRSDARCTHAAACHSMAQQLPPDAAGVEEERGRLMQQAQAELSAAATAADSSSTEEAAVEYAFEVAELQMEHARLMMTMVDLQQHRAAALAAWETAVGVWAATAAVAAAAVAAQSQQQKEKVSEALGLLSLAHYNRACALSMALQLLDPGPAMAPLVAEARQSLQHAVAGAY